MPARPADPRSNPLLSRLDLDVAHDLALLPAELVWATTWMDEANDALAPLLGWPALPVLDPMQPSAEDAYFRLHWKTRSIFRHAAGRGFTWVDDEITGADQEWIDEHHPGAALLLRVDPRTGATRGDLDALRTWLDGTTTTEAPRPAGRLDQAR